MTLVCGLKQRKAAFLFADTAWVDPTTGNVRGFHSKIFGGDQFPWAMAITAEMGVAGAKVLSGLNPRNVKGLCRDLRAALPAFEQASAGEGLPNASIRIMVACWDARKASPRLFCIHNNDPATEAVGEPGELVEVDYHFGSDDEALAEVWGGGSPADPKCFDTEHDAVAVYDRLRARPYVFAGRLGHWIGGELERVTVTRRGVSLEALKVWNDKVGSTINAVARDA